MSGVTCGHGAGNGPMVSFRGEERYGKKQSCHKIEDHWGKPPGEVIASIGPLPERKYYLTYSVDGPIFAIIPAHSLHRGVFQKKMVRGTGGFPPVESVDSGHLGDETGAPCIMDYLVYTCR